MIMRTTRRTLSGKVIDNRNFDSIKIKHILRRSSTPYYQVITIWIGGSHSGQRLHYLRNIAVGTGTFFNFLNTY